MNFSQPLSTMETGEESFILSTIFVLTIAVLPEATTQLFARWGNSGTTAMIRIGQGSAKSESGTFGMVSRQFSACSKSQ